MICYLPKVITRSWGGVGRGHVKLRYRRLERRHSAPRFFPLLHQSRLLTNTKSFLWDPRFLRKNTPEIPPAQPQSKMENIQHSFGENLRRKTCFHSSRFKTCQNMEFSLDLLVNKVSKWHFMFVTQRVQDIYSMSLCTLGLKHDNYKLFSLPFTGCTIEVQ